MLIFLLNKPTQFDSPFFQHLAANGSTAFTVLYLQHAASSSDIELHHATNWGIDLYGGYAFRNVKDADTAAKAAEILQSLKTSRLITNGYKAGFAPFIAAALQLAIPMDLRIDSVMFSKPWYLRPVHRMMMKKRYDIFERLLTTGTKGREYLEAGGIEKSRIGWWPYCTDNAFFERKRNAGAASLLMQQHAALLEGRKVVIAVCKLNNRENPVELMAAFQALQRNDIALIVVGDGPLMSTVNEMKNTMPGKPILVAGRVPYIQLPAWYALAHVFVHTAANEPWGVSVQEAIAANLALVCSDRVGSAFDLIKNGENGYIYPSGELKALADALRKSLLLDESAKTAANKQLMAEWNYEQVEKVLLQNF